MSERRTVLITGGASGIGAHLTQEFIKRGFRTATTDINEEGLQRTLASAVRRDTALAMRLDVRDPHNWEEVLGRVVEAWGSLDLLLNVGGVLRPGYVYDNDAATVDLHIDVNTKGTIYGCQAAARQMVRQGSGHIINVSSLAGVSPVPGLNLYSASKYAVRGFSLAIAQELAPLGVYVTVLCPDAVRTPMLDLQVDHEAASLTFSGNDEPLTVEDLSRAVFDQVLPHRPMELVMPLGRGVLARTANLFPGLTKAIMPALQKKGRRRQQALKGRGPGAEEDGA